MKADDDLFVNDYDYDPPSPWLLKYAALSVSQAMQYIRELITIGKKARKIKIRQPLQSVFIVCDNPYLVWNPEFRQMVKSELNVRYVVVQPNLSPIAISFDEQLTPELIEEGNRNQENRDQIMARKQEERLSRVKV